MLSHNAPDAAAVKYLQIIDCRPQSSALGVPQR
jgi:hypothetical protein